MASKKEQKRLIKLIKTGDEKAWDEFKKEYIPFILRVIKTSQMKDIVEDFENEIIAEVLKQGFDYVKKAEKITTLDGLMTIIVRRLIIRYSKKGVKSQSLKGEGYDENVPSNDLNPEEELIENEAALLLEKDKEYLNICMERLTKTQRLVLRLWEEGKSWAEIARIRRVAQSAIAQIKDAAFNRLRECINELRRIHQINQPVYNG